MKVSIYSREAIEKLIEYNFPKNTAVISFYDPKGIRSDNLTPVDYKNNAEIVISDDHCDGCSLCADICPSNALYLERA